MPSSQSLRPSATGAIAVFNLGCHGLTVFGMAVRICQRHGHGEDAKTVPPDSQIENGDGPDSAPAPIVVGSSELNKRACFVPFPAEDASITPKMLEQFRIPLLMGAILVASGLVHLALLWFSGAEWSGPLSIRKPGLFGVSAGVTVWSIAWVLTQLAPHRHDQRLVNGLSAGLLLEVGLITLQYWRGVPSHFNRTTALDAMIESIMLGLILLVTVGIAWLAWRSRHLRPMAESRAIAIRAGLWLLLVSCGLGFVATIAGEWNLAHGRPPEVWGRAGVLKYPHGAALHAIQALPLLTMFLQKFRVAHAAAVLKGAVALQVLFLVHAVWQTLQGRSRTDVDRQGLAVLAGAGLLLILLAQIRRAWQVARSHFEAGHQNGRCERSGCGCRRSAGL